MTYGHIKTAAMRLSKRQRIRLAHKLARGIPYKCVEVREAWAKEIARRVAEIDAGTAILVSADEVFAEARRAVDRVRQDKLQHSTPEIENACLDEVDRRIRLQDAGLIDDIDADDLFRE